MENPFQIFNSPIFGQVRAAYLDGVAWFVGLDVARVLGYRNGSRDVERHVAEEDRRKVLIPVFDVPNQCMKSIRRHTLIINESGLYSLVLASQLPAAQEFKHWVTSEVLPAIRKTGSYSLLETPGQDLPVVEQSPDQFQISLEPLALADKLLEVADKFSDPQLRDKVLIHVINNLCGRNIF